MDTADLGRNSIQTADSDFEDELEYILRLDSSDNEVTYEEDIDEPEEDIDEPSTSKGKRLRPTKKKKTGQKKTCSKSPGYKVIWNVVEKADPVTLPDNVPDFIETCD